MTTPIRSIAGLSGPLALGEDHDVSALADQTPLRLKTVKKIKKATLEGEEEVEEEDYIGQEWTLL